VIKVMDGIKRCGTFKSRIAGVHLGLDDDLFRG